MKGLAERPWARVGRVGLEVERLLIYTNIWACEGLCNFGDLSLQGNTRPTLCIDMRYQPGCFDELDNRRPVDGVVQAIFRLKLVMTDWFEEVGIALVEILHGTKVLGIHP